MTNDSKSRHQRAAEEWRAQVDAEVLAAADRATMENDSKRRQPHSSRGVEWAGGRDD